MFFEPFGPDVPRFVYLLIVAVATMFGAWEGGLTGIATENSKLKKFHHDIEAGKYLILIYARKEQGAAVRALMRAKHPEAELVAVNTHFINPFKPVRRRHPAERRARTCAGARMMMRHVATNGVARRAAAAEERFRMAVARHRSPQEL